MRRVLLNEEANDLRPYSDEPKQRAGGESRAIWMVGCGALHLQHILHAFASRAARAAIRGFRLGVLASGMILFGGGLELHAEIADTLQSEINRALTSVQTVMVEVPDRADAARVARLAEQLYTARQESGGFAGASPNSKTVHQIWSLSEAVRLKERPDLIWEAVRSLQNQNRDLRMQLIEVKSEVAALKAARDLNSNVHDNISHASERRVTADTELTPQAPRHRVPVPSSRPVFALAESTPVNRSSLDLSTSGSEGPANQTATFVKLAARQIANGLTRTRTAAMLAKQERAFTLDVERRLSWTSEDEGPEHLDSALGLSLRTAKSETTDSSRGRIRFFPNGSSTGGRISLSLEGYHADITVDWLTGKANVEFNQHTAEARTF